MSGLRKVLALALSATALSAGVAHAADWWPFKIASAKDGDLKNVQEIEYKPLDKAEKPWKLCVLFPHLQDSYWVSVDYGIVDVVLESNAFSGGQVSGGQAESAARRS